MSLDGYVAVERRVVISRRRSAQSISVELVKARAETQGTTRSRATSESSAAVARTSGTLRVDSRPAGVDVFVDGKRVGRTPLSLDSVDAGEHVIRLEQVGYRRWTSSVHVVAGERSTVTASLER